MDSKEQIDLFKYLRATDFDSPETIEQMKGIMEELAKVLESAKIDRDKMLTTFNAEAIAKNYIQNHRPVLAVSKDFFFAGLLTGLMINSK